MVALQRAQEAVANASAYTDMKVAWAHSDGMIANSKLISAEPPAIIAVAIATAKQMETHPSLSPLHITNILQSPGQGQCLVQGPGCGC